MLTIRPPAYADHCVPLRDVPGDYRFVAHHGRAGATEMWGDHDRDFGDTIIDLNYIRERWAPLFELIAVDVLLTDLHQVMVTLRRR